MGGFCNFIVEALGEDRFCAGAGDATFECKSL